MIDRCIIQVVKTTSALFGIVLQAWLLVSCQTESSDRFTDQGIMPGLASVVTLHPDSTTIELSDFVDEPYTLDSVTVWPPVPASQHGTRLTITTAPDTWLAEVRCWKQGQAYAIPLRHSTQQSVTLRYRGSARQVFARGEFNGWNGQQTRLEKNDDQFTYTFSLSPGRYQYLLMVDGKEIRDPLNKDSVENGMGGWNSVLTVEGANPQGVPFISTTSATPTAVELTLTQPATEVVAYWQNFRLTQVTSDGQHIIVSIPQGAEQPARSFIRVWAANKHGVSNDVLVPLQQGHVLNDVASLSRRDKEAQVLYFMMIDRFSNGNPDNDNPVNDPSVHPKANFFGGDLDGVARKIIDGYFDSLGINTIWLSPISRNPVGAYGHYPQPATAFSAYHGYWPVSLRTVDPRFGTPGELEKLLKEAHARNINVIVDYVAHHVHQEHPLFREKPHWFTPLYLPDGSRNTERWDDHRLTTWFDVFLPTLDLQKAEVVNPMTDTAMHWLQHYELDGFRHDASKHIDLLFWRTLTKKIKQFSKQHPDRSIFQIGETYGSRELVQGYINSGMLDAQFDFNVYDDAVATFAKPGVPFSRVLNSVEESLNYFGDHHLMGNVTGNQDRARFISYADGSLRFDEDAKKAGWNREIKVQDTTAYRKLQSLIAFTMTIPGVPVVYYGDELGEAGGNDPDNRRMMRFSNLYGHEEKTKAITSKLIHLRRSQLALLYGDWKALSPSADVAVITRSYFNQQVVIVFNKSADRQTVALNQGAERLRTNFEGTLVTNKSACKLTLAPYSFEILTHQNNPPE